MKRIALTGPSGAGKGYVATLLCQKGIAYLDTDHLVHTLYQGGKLPDLIAARFGSAVMGEDGSVNRPMLSQIVFSDKQALRDLNAIVHTEVEQQVQVWLKDKESEGYAAALVDAPQLFEAGADKLCDYTVAILVNQETALKRILNRDDISIDTAKNRLNVQLRL